MHCFKKKINFFLKAPVQWRHLQPRAVVALPKAKSGHVWPPPAKFDRKMARCGRLQLDQAAQPHLWPHSLMGGVAKSSHRHA